MQISPQFFIIWCLIPGLFAFDVSPEYENDSASHRYRRMRDLEGGGVFFNSYNDPESRHHKNPKEKNAPNRPFEVASIIITNLPSHVPSRAPSVLLSNEPTVVDSDEPSYLPSVRSSEMPSAVISGVPSLEQSNSPTVEKTVEPSENPSDIPTAIKSDLPSGRPTVNPSMEASTSPSSKPTAAPTVSPTLQSSNMPTAIASSTPSTIHSAIPSMEESTRPSENPTVASSSIPSLIASHVPTTVATLSPSVTHSSTPSVKVSTFPSAKPTLVTSSSPSLVASNLPTAITSSSPSVAHSFVPSVEPTTEPPSLPPSATKTAFPIVEASKVPSATPSIISSMTPSVPTAVASSSPSLESNNVFLKPSSLPITNSSNSTTTPCQYSSDGVYGESSSIIISLDFQYEVVYLSQGEELLQSEMIPKIEAAILNDIIPALLPSCSVQSRRRTLRAGNLPQSGGHRSLNIIGVDTLPADTVDENETCASTSTGEGSTCELVNGGMRIFVDENFSNSEINNIQALALVLIQAQMTNGAYNNGVHDDIVRVTFVEKSPNSETTETTLELPSTGGIDRGGQNTAGYIVMASCVAIAAIALAMIGHKKQQSNRYSDAMGDEEMKDSDGEGPDFSDVDQSMAVTETTATPLGHGEMPMPPQLLGRMYDDSEIEDPNF